MSGPDVRLRVSVGEEPGSVGASLGTLAVIRLWVHIRETPRVSKTSSAGPLYISSLGLLM